jgi:hypothetical protein
VATHRTNVVLPAPVGAQHGQDHPLLRIQVQAIESDGLSETLDDSEGLDHRGHPLLLDSTDLSAHMTDLVRWM